MRFFQLWLMIIGILFVSCTLLSCGESPPEEEETNTAVKLEAVPGTSLHRISLTPEAIKRIDLQVTPVQEKMVNGTQQKVVPYSAVLYDENGLTWVYLSLSPLTFMRSQITIDHIEGKLAILTSGPPASSNVVIVGSSELFGSEFLDSIQP